LGENCKEFGENLQGDYRMKILLVGDFSSDFDEGLKNIAKYTYEYLAKKHDVKTINAKRILSFQTINILKNYKPDIIHYFTAPTMSAFILLKLLSLKRPQSKTVISALHSKPSPFLKTKIFKLIIKYLFKPDLILHQTNPELFKDVSKDMAFFPNGVDTKRFKPVDKEKKRELRSKYGLVGNKFTILHVGHLSKKRNLEIFAHIQKLSEDYQTLIIAGTYVYEDHKLLADLKNAGCKVMTGYIENIEEIYALADCYVFPVSCGNTINIPLSILESMACNLPVITIKYPTFNTLFDEGNGLFFVNDATEIPEKLKELQTALQSGLTVKTREKVLQYSWESLTEDLEEIYR